MLSLSGELDIATATRLNERLIEVTSREGVSILGASGKSVGLWVELKPAAVEVDGRLEVFPVAVVRNPAC